MKLHYNNNRFPFISVIEKPRVVWIQSSHFPFVPSQRSRTGEGRRPPFIHADALTYYIHWNWKTPTIKLSEDWLHAMHIQTVTSIWGNIFILTWVTGGVIFIYARNKNEVIWDLWQNVFLWLLFLKCGSVCVQMEVSAFANLLLQGYDSSNYFMPWTGWHHPTCSSSYNFLNCL